MNVKIYKPGKNAMQSGHAKMHDWVLEYETTSSRAPEPLMGWVSSGDTLGQVKLKFPSAEQAVEFAKGKGWDYTVQAPRERKLRPRNYGDNFKYVPYEESR
jgi:hypothetical protein